MIDIYKRSRQLHFNSVNGDHKSVKINDQLANEG